MKSYKREAFCIKNTKIWLPFIIIGTCFLKTSAFRVHRLDNPEHCKKRITYFKEYIVLSEEPAVLKCPSFQYLKLNFSKMSELSLNLFWSKNGSNSLYFGEEPRLQPLDESLWFFPALPKDTGIYTCILRNSSFCIEVALTLTVMTESETSLPAIAYEQIAYEELEFRMFCPDLKEFTQHHSDVQLRWSKDGLLLPNDNKKYSYTSGTTYLEINDIRKDDGGYYTCALAFTHGNREYTISRIIYLQTVGQMKMYHPVIVSPSNMTIAAALGSKLVIPCKAFTGYGASSVTIVMWLANDSYIDEYFNDDRVIEGQFEETTENGANYIQVPLIFEKVMEEDFTTNFKCVARNEHGVQVLPTQIRLLASSFNWYFAAVPAFLVALIVVILVIYKHRKSRSKKDYSLTKL